MFLLQTSGHSFTTIYDKVIPKNIMNEFIDIKSAVQEFESQNALSFSQHCTEFYKNFLCHITVATGKVSLCRMSFTIRPVKKKKGSSNCLTVKLYFCALLLFYPIHYTHFKFKQSPQAEDPDSSHTDE